jgi:hypothetical protein
LRFLGKLLIMLLWIAILKVILPLFGKTVVGVHWRKAERDVQFAVRCVDSHPPVDESDHFFSLAALNPSVDSANLYLLLCFLPLVSFLLISFQHLML